MRLAKYKDRHGAIAVGRLDGQHLLPLVGQDGRRATLSAVLRAIGEGRDSELRSDESQPANSLSDVQLLAPIDEHEVWGAGVTYLRSKIAREEESEKAASFYDLVYQADRPELFFKATPHRVVGHGGAIRVRADSKWTVPEPELGLVLTPELRLVGFTLGNDVSARDIEGRNPLYLPQAKVYDGCCALGPVITTVDSLPPLEDVEITMRIQRGQSVLFEGQTQASRIVRTWDELTQWLGRDNSFPNGAILLTGTGIVPPDDLSLQTGDVVEIACPAIGVLSNPVA